MMMKPEKAVSKTQHKILDAPVHLGSMAATLEAGVDDLKSIWAVQRDDNLVSTSC